MRCPDRQGRDRSPTIDGTRARSSPGSPCANRFNRVPPRFRRLAGSCARGGRRPGRGRAPGPALAALCAVPIEIYWFVRHPLLAGAGHRDPAGVRSGANRRGDPAAAAGKPRRVGKTGGSDAARRRRRRTRHPCRTGRRRAAAGAPLPASIDLSAWALGGPATVVAGIAAALFLLTWIPHYLTWPWWPDVDQFAVSAQSWSAGIVPYRDLAGFRLPRPDLLHFLLGKIFGWGATVAFYAMDAAFVVVLGVALAAWSRRLFGSALPGLVSYLTFLGPYLSLDYSLVAQRDWHAPLLVVLGLFALEVWPGKRGRADLGAGARPGVRIPSPRNRVPARRMAAAVDEGARPAGEPWRRAIRPWLAWSALLAVALLLAFSPLILAGILDDLVRCVLSALAGALQRRHTAYTFEHGPGRLFPRSGNDARARGRGRAGGRRSRGAATSGPNLGAGAARASSSTSQ